MGHRKRALLAVVAMLFCGSASVQAAVRLPQVFGSGMVLQRQVVLPVWGWDNPGP